MTNINEQAIAHIESTISEMEGNILFWQDELSEVSAAGGILRHGQLDRIRQRLLDCERKLAIYVYISALLMQPNEKPEPCDSAVTVETETYGGRGQTVADRLQKK